MEIISSSINSDSIDLVTSSPVTGLTLSYGDKKFTTEKQLSDINSAGFSITKEDLGLDTLDNRYFKIELWGNSGETENSLGVYHIDIENNKETPLYNAGILKTELDNLNYLDGVLQSLNERKAFREANDFFFNYKIFLEKKLNGNNFIQNIKRQKKPRSNN